MFYQAAPPSRLENGIREHEAVGKHRKINQSASVRVDEKYQRASKLMAYGQSVVVATDGNYFVRA